MKKYIILLVLSLLLISNNIFCQGKVPKNIIIMISDGCGYNHIQSTDLYQNGEFNSQKYEKFPVKFFVSTYPGLADIGDTLFYPVKPYDSEKAWSDFEYVKKDITCSAAAGTAISTGYKTYNGSICRSIDKKKDLTNLSELAKSKHKSAGVVTSVQWCHATPATFVAHNDSRENYSEIAKYMILDSKVDVIMGCGHPYYDENGNKRDNAKTFQYVGDSLTWQYLKCGNINYNYPNSHKTVQDIDGDGAPDPWLLIETKKEFEKLTKGKTPKRVLGTAQVYKTLQQERGMQDVNYLHGQSIKNEDPDSLIANGNTNVPELSTMALGAINVLDNNKNGFFLMIEGGAIDWAAHGNQIGRMIAEEIRFNNTVDSVINWVETNSSWDETLLIVTADHETGYITKQFTGNPENWEQLPKSEKGQLPKIQWNTTNHSNSLVPLYAKGAGSELFKGYADENDIKRGKYLDNTEIGQLVFFLWGK